MTNDNPKKADPADDRPSNLVKDPDDWVTGDERMTGAQASYLKTLCEEAGEAFDDALSKAEASKRIDELQARTGRGEPAPGHDRRGAHGGGGSRASRDGAAPSERHDRARG